jgi:hypothetical protein
MYFLQQSNSHLIPVTAAGNNFVVLAAFRFGNGSSSLITFVIDTASLVYV